MQLYLDGKTKTEVAIERIQSFAPPERYYGCFSGGKDSVAIHRLAAMAGIPVTAQLNPEWVEWLMGFPNGWLNLTSPGSAGTSRTG